MTHFPAPPTASHAETVAKALTRAYSLGQIYWQQADSESYSQNKRADETDQKFKDLLADTAALFSAPVVASRVARWRWVDCTPHEGYFVRDAEGPWVKFEDVSQGEQPALAQLAPISDERISEIWQAEFVIETPLKVSPVHKFARALLSEAVHPSTAPKDGAALGDTSALVKRAYDLGMDLT